MVALAVAATLVGPFNAAVADSTGTQSVTNESVTAEIDTFVELDGYDIVTDSETVYWYNNSSSSYEEVTSGTDYEMNYDPGQIKALSGGSIGDGDELKVSYDYQATDGTTTTIAGLVPLFVVLLILGVLAAKIQKMM